MAFKYRKPDPKELEKRANQKGGDFQGFIKDEFSTYTVKKGDNWIRIFPGTWEGARHFALEIYVHYGIGPDRASVLCDTKMRGKPCAICDARNKLAKTDPAEADELKPTKRSLMWVMDQKDSKGPLVWAAPWTVERDIGKISHDKTTGKWLDIIDPAGGYDVMFDREGEQRMVKYTGLQLSRKKSALDPDDVDFVADNPLTKVLRYRSYEEVKQLYTGNVAESDDDEDEAPVRKRREAAEDDDTEEAPPRRRRSLDVEDEEDEAPRRRKAAVEDDEEDEPPRRRRRAEPEEDEEEVAPPRKRRAVVEEEDEEEVAPPRRKRAVVEDEDDEPAPRRSVRSRTSEPDDDDEEEAPPRKRRARAEEDDEEEEPVRPARKRAAVVEDDEEEEAPRPRRRAPVEDDDEEEDEAPAKKPTLRAALAKRKK